MRIIFFNLFTIFFSVNSSLNPFQERIVVEKTLYTFLVDYLRIADDSIKMLTNLIQKYDEESFNIFCHKNIAINPNFNVGLFLQANDFKITTTTDEFSLLFLFILNFLKEEDIEQIRKLKKKLLIININIQQNLFIFKILMDEYKMFLDLLGNAESYVMKIESYLETFLTIKNQPYLFFNSIHSTSMFTENIIKTWAAFRNEYNNFKQNTISIRNSLEITE